MRVDNFLSNNYIEYNKTLSFEESLNIIRLYLRDVINGLKKSDTWRIQLTITINFISSKDDNNEVCIIHSKSCNIEIMINDEPDEF